MFSSVYIRDPSKLLRRQKGKKKKAFGKRQGITQITKQFEKQKQLEQTENVQMTKAK